MFSTYADLPYSLGAAWGNSRHYDLGCARGGSDSDFARISITELRLNPFRPVTPSPPSVPLSSRRLSRPGQSVLSPSPKYLLEITYNKRFENNGYPAHGQVFAQ